MPPEAGQNVTPGPGRRKRQRWGRGLTASQQEKGKPREGGSCPQHSGAPGMHLVQGGVGDRCRCEVGTLWALGFQQRKEAQDSKGPGQRHAWTERHQESGRTGGCRVQ